MKLRKTIIYLALVAVFIFYLIKADYIFNVLIPTNHQALRVERILPQAGAELFIEIEEARVMEQKWKKILYVRGWTAVEPSMDSTDINLVLSSGQGQMVFTTPDEKIINRVLAVPQERFEQMIIKGFEYYVPLFLLPKDTLTIGLMIEGKEMTHFGVSEKDILEWQEGVVVHRKIVDL